MPPFLPHLETPDELADHIADQVGIYGAHEDESCTEQRPCRPCYVLDLTERIRAAVQNENLLVAMEQMPAPAPPRVRVPPAAEQLSLPSPTAEELERQRAKVRARYRKGGCTCDLSLTRMHRDDCPAAVQVT